MKRTQTLIQVAIMVTLLVILGMMPPMPLGFIPVPIILQNIGVMLSAILLGAKKGTVVVLLFLILGCFLPIFTGGGMTLVVLSGPTAGYVVSWLFVPILFVVLSKCLPRQHSYLIFMSMWVSGVLMVNVLGAFWLSHYTHTSIVATLLSNLIFLPGDTIKAIIATIIGTRYRKHLSLD